jgi:hypothetical protein
MYWRLCFWPGWSAADLRALRLILTMAGSRGNPGAAQVIRYQSERLGLTVVVS